MGNNNTTSYVGELFSKKTKDPTRSGNNETMATTGDVKFKLASKEHVDELAIQAETKLRTLESAGIFLVDENEISKSKNMTVYLCMLVMLMLLPVHPFWRGMFVEFTVCLSMLISFWLKMADTSDGYGRMRLAADGRKGCFFWRMITFGWWSDEVETMMVNMKHSKDEFKDVVNMWPMAMGDFSESKFAELGTKLTHSAIVKVENQILKIYYPVSNLPRFYVDLCNIDKVEVFKFHHKIYLTSVEISLPGVGNKPPSKKFSKRLPICVKTRKSKGERQFAFYILPIVKRNKELLYKLLVSGSGMMQIGQKFQMNNLVEQVTKECRLKCSNGNMEDHTIEMINILINRLGHKLLTEEIIFNPIKSIIAQKLKKTFSMFNIGVQELDFGERYPLIQKLGEPWMNERGLWARVEVITEEKRSFTVGVNRDVSNNTEDTESPSSDSESEHISVEGETMAQWIDTEIGDNMSFKMDVLMFDLEFILNIPPPGRELARPGHIWLGLCHVPRVEIELHIQGTGPKVTSIFNRIRAIMKKAVIKRLNTKLETEWIYPNMKSFPLMFPS